MSNPTNVEHLPEFEGVDNMGRCHTKTSKQWVACGVETKFLLLGIKKFEIIGYIE